MFVGVTTEVDACLGMLSPTWKGLTAAVETLAT